MVTLSVGIDEDNIRKLHGESTNNKFFLSRPFLFPLQEQSVIFKALITKLQRPRLMTGFLSEGVNVISKNRLARYFSMHFIVNINCNFFFESVADSNRNLKKKITNARDEMAQFFLPWQVVFSQSRQRSFLSGSTAGFVQFILIHNSTIRDAILARRLLNERKELPRYLASRDFSLFI